MNNEWKPVPGYNGKYEASRDGLIKCAAKIVETKKGPRFWKERILQEIDGRVVLVHPVTNTKTFWRATELVYKTFIGEIPEGFTVGKDKNGDLFLKEKPFAGRKTGKSETLCWHCKNAVPDKQGNGCSWSRKLEPVEGWTATDSLLNMGCGYCVHECPEFVKDE